MLEKGYNPQPKRKIVPSVTALTNIAHAMSIDLNELSETIGNLEFSLDKDAESATNSKITFSSQEENLIKNIAS